MRGPAAKAASAGAADVAAAMPAGPEVDSAAAVAVTRERGAVDSAAAVAAPEVRAAKGAAASAAVAADLVAGPAAHPAAVDHQRAAAQEAAMPHNHSINERKATLRRGVTLLELILALGLSVLVLLAVGMAIDLHFRMLDVRRTNVEEAQLVRVIFEQFRKDLIGAMQSMPPDLSGLETVTGNAASAASGQAAGALDALGAGDDLSMLADLALGMEGGTAGQLGSISSVLGLYGTSTELRVDVSRLPRIDEYESLMMAASGVEVTDIPSDVKTVTYFLAGEEAMVGSAPVGMAFAVEPSTTGFGRGLMRSQVARAAASYAASGGYDMSAYDNARLLADEVIGLQFAYFDGLEWYMDWDSDLMGGLPKAVEVVLTIQPTYALSDAAQARAEYGQVVPEQTYRLVIHLPTSNLDAALAEETVDMSGEVAP